MKNATEEKCTHSQIDHEYDGFLQNVERRFNSNVEGGERLFTTKKDGLWDAYLSAFPESERQYYNCSACRHFINRYGGLMTIDVSGRTRSAVWNLGDAPERYKKSITAMLKVLSKAKVSGVFLSNSSILGTPVTGEWTHFAVKSPHIYGGLTKTAGQAMAEKREDFKNIITALSIFSTEVLSQAVTLLKSDSLYRSEAVLGPAEWLQKLQTEQNSAKGNKSNIVWRAIASAPAGFCHPRSSMIGTLLSDISSGEFEFSEVAARFAAKMEPLSYQRPKAAPTSGNIEQAEKIVEQMGIRSALNRRFARLEDIEKLWTPIEVDATPESDSVFGHLAPKKRSDNTLDMDQVPPQAITWEKFNRTVLPDALGIELSIGDGMRMNPTRFPFAALVTAIDVEAPIIHQWDNPVSWYLYSSGSPSKQWGIVPGWQKITAISNKPSMWSGNDRNNNQGDGIFFIIDGAVDQHNDSLALFPSTLKSELHPIRATIEAFSAAGKLEGHEQANACGMAFFNDNNPTSLVLRVTTDDGTLKYKLDRWD